MSMKLLVFKIFRSLGVLYFLRKLKKDKVTVLCFHRVSNEYSPSWPPMDVEVFEKLMIYISKHYDVKLPKHIGVNKGKKPELIVTFDDGYRDFITDALPILIKYKIPVVHHVVINSIEKGIAPWTQRLNKVLEALMANGISPNLVKFNVSIDWAPENIEKIALLVYQQLLSLDDSSRLSIIEEFENLMPDYIPDIQLMDIEEVKILGASDIVEIGSHTYSHNNLASIKNQEDLHFEIVESKHKLEKLLGANCECIGLPNGQYNDNVLEACKLAGYKYIFLLEEKLWDRQESNVHIIPRILIHHESFIENCFKIENFHNVVKRLIKA